MYNVPEVSGSEQNFFQALQVPRVVSALQDRSHHKSSNRWPSFHLISYIFDCIFSISGFFSFIYSCFFFLPLKKKSLCVLKICLYGHASHTCSTRGDQKRSSEPLGLEQLMVLRCYVSPGNRIQVLCSQLLSHPIPPAPIYGICLFVCLFIKEDKSLTLQPRMIFLCSSGWPPASASQVLGFQVCSRVSLDMSRCLNAHCVLLVLVVYSQAVLTCSWGQRFMLYSLGMWQPLPVCCVCVAMEWHVSHNESCHIPVPW